MFDKKQKQNTTVGKDLQVHSMSMNLCLDMGVALPIFPMGQAANVLVPVYF